MLHFVMPGLVPGIHALFFSIQNVDGRVKPGHDDVADATSSFRQIIERDAPETQG
jgi:hypothetical protein